MDWSNIFLLFQFRKQQKCIILTEHGKRSLHFFLNNSWNTTFLYNLSHKKNTNLIANLRKKKLQRRKKLLKLQQYVLQQIFLRENVMFRWKQNPLGNDFIFNVSQVQVA